MSEQTLVGVDCWYRLTAFRIYKYLKLLSPEYNYCFAKIPEGFMRLGVTGSSAFGEPAFQWLFDMGVSVEFYRLKYIRNDFRSL